MELPGGNDYRNQTENQNAEIGNAPASGMINDYDAHTAAQFSALNTVTPPDVWGSVTSPVVPVASGHEGTVVMASETSPSLLESELPLVNPGHEPPMGPLSPYVGSVSRRPLVELLPSSRQLVSIAAVFLFAFVAVGVVWSQTRQPDATVADGVGENQGTEFASGISDDSDQLVDGNDKAGVSQGQFESEDAGEVAELTGLDDDDAGSNDAEDSKYGEDDDDLGASDAADNTDDDIEKDVDADSDTDTDDETEQTTSTVETTTVTEPETTTSSTTETTEAPKEETTTTTTTTETTTTTQPTTVPSEVITIRGVLTESFTDCVSHLVLDASGNAVPSNGGISCDGGSWIVVNRTKIQTSAGYVRSGYYNKHKGISPGVTVVVKAAKTEWGNLGLACDECYYSAVDTGPSTVEIKGKISQINCVGSGRFDRDEENSPMPLIPCEAGSSITVNGTRIATVGVDGDGNYYHRHKLNWEEGMSVKVTATSGEPTLNCKGCGVNILS